MFHVRFLCNNSKSITLNASSPPPGVLTDSTFLNPPSPISESEEKKEANPCGVVNQEEEEEDDRRGWGTRKSNYYGGIEDVRSVLGAFNR